VHWLVECLKQSRTVDEKDFLCYEYSADPPVASTDSRFEKNKLLLSLSVSF